MVASLIKDFKATDPNGFLVYFSDHGEEVYDTPPHKLRGVMKTTRRVICTPFRSCCGRQKNGKRLIRVISQDVDRKYSLAELIHTWSDLAGLSYDGYDPTRSVVNPQFKETTRWIGNPYKKTH